MATPKKKYPSAAVYRDSPPTTLFVPSRVIVAPEINDRECLIAVVFATAVLIPTAEFPATVHIGVDYEADAVRKGKAALQVELLFTLEGEVHNQHVYVVEKTETRKNTSMDHLDITLSLSKEKERSRIQATTANAFVEETGTNETVICAFPLQFTLSPRELTVPPSDMP